MPAWIILTEWTARAILVLLVGLSIWSVTIMIDRRRALKRAQTLADFAEARTLIEAGNWDGLKAWAAKADDLSDLRKGALRAALASPAEPESIDRAVRSFLTTERNKLENGLTTLATLGSNAPFIGLFGTVLGIIQAFGALAGNNSNTNSVMSGISEALVATAIGLFVAIPAVVAYNVFTRKLRELLTESESLRDLYVSRRCAGGS